MFGAKRGEGKWHVGGRDGDDEWEVVCDAGGH